MIWEYDFYDLDYVLSALGIEDPKGQSAKALPSAPIGKRRLFSGKKLIEYLDALFEDEAQS